MGKQSQLNYPSRWAIVKRAILTTAVAAGAVVGTVAAAATLPLAAAVIAGGAAVVTTTLFASNLAYNKAMREAGQRADPAKAAAFRKLVLEGCEEEGLKPPSRIWLIDPSPDSKFWGKGGHLPNAAAMRIGRLGKGMVMAKQSMMDLLSPAETRAVIKHELSHYRHAVSRGGIAFGLTTLAASGAALATMLTGGWATVIPVSVAYFTGVSVVDALGLARSRRHERLADREAVKTPQDAALLRSALTKNKIAAIRFYLEQDSKDRPRKSSGRKREEKEAFGEPPKQPPTDEQIAAALLKKPKLRTRLRHALVDGTHPLEYERLTALDAIAGRPWLPSNAPTTLPPRTPAREEGGIDVEMPQQRTPIPPREAREPALAGVGTSATGSRSPGAPPPIGGPPPMGLV